MRHERDVLLRRVKEAEERIKIQDGLCGPLPKIPRRELGSGLREGTAVALFSDVHCEEEVLPGATPIPNVYNLKVSDVRIGRFFSGVDWLIQKERQACKIRDMILWLGGDLMSGLIHEENLETSAHPPIATLLWLYPHLVSGIQLLLEKTGIEHLQIVCSYGNHGRDTKKCRFATGAHHSYEWGMYQILGEHLKGDPRVSVLADPSEHQYARAYDFDLHFHHGHRINFGGGVGGITIPVNKAIAQWDQVRRSDLHHFGHFHQLLWLRSGIINGSVIGFNSYAMGIKASPEPPQQAFYVLDSKRGRTAQSPVWVAE
jgi:hypothetical protein